MGLLALIQGVPSEARQWLDQSVSFIQSTPWLSQAMPWMVGICHASLGYATRQEGAAVQTGHHLYHALKIGIELRYPRPCTTALPLLALLLGNQGEIVRAVESYALASTYGHVAHSRWFEDVAGKHIAAAAETLPPDVVAAAQERGRARDLWATVEEVLEELTKDPQGLPPGS